MLGQKPSKQLLLNPVPLPEPLISKPLTTDPILSPDFTHAVKVSLNIQISIVFGLSYPRLASSRSIHRKPHLCVRSPSLPNQGTGPSLAGPDSRSRLKTHVPGYRRSSYSRSCAHTSFIPCLTGLTLTVGFVDL